MPQKVLGVAGELFYKNSNYNPKKQGMGEFYNNVAHSQYDTGI